MHLRHEAVPCGDAQRVARQRAAPRAEFDVMDGLGPPGADPDVGQPQPDQLAEHLADLGRGDEIARRAERIAAVVIAGVRLAHVVLAG